MPCVFFDFFSFPQWVRCFRRDSAPLYQLINGCRWLIYYFFHPLYRTARPTHKISGRNNVPDSMAYHLKIATTSTFFFYLDDVLHGIVIKFCIWDDDKFNWGFTGGFRIQERPTSASWIVCRKARDFIIVTGAKSSTVRDVMNKKVPTFAYPANVW